MPCHELGWCVCVHRFNFGGAAVCGIRPALVQPTQLDTAFVHTLDTKGPGTPGTWTRDLVAGGTRTAPTLDRQGKVQVLPKPGNKGDPGGLLDAFHW